MIYYIITGIIGILIWMRNKFIKDKTYIKARVWAYF